MKSVNDPTGVKANSCENAYYAMTSPLMVKCGVGIQQRLPASSLQASAAILWQATAFLHRAQCSTRRTFTNPCSRME
jgi:hypothetical protein